LSTWLLSADRGNNKSWGLMNLFLFFYFPFFFQDVVSASAIAAAAGVAGGDFNGESHAHGDS